MSKNPFADTAWETSSGGGDMLPAGDHLVTIDSIDGTGTSSGGWPQLEVKASNDKGSITDWIVLKEGAQFRAAALFAACDMEKPGDGQVIEEGEGFRLDTAYLIQCVGQKVGVLVRKEPDYKDPTKTRRKVKGWCRSTELTEDDLAGDTSGFEAVSSGSSADIPF